MGGRNEDDSEAATDGFDWLGDFDDEGLQGEQGRWYRDDGTSTEKADQEYCIDDSPTAATVMAGRTTAGGDVNGGAGAEEEGIATEDPARERHKAAERERRKSMRELFLSLHALLPHGHSVRKEQSAILDEVIGYIPLAASRLSTLRGNYYHQNASRVLPTAGAPPTSSGSTSGGSCRRENNQRRRHHPYSSACSSSSSTTYGRSSCDPIYFDGQSPVRSQPPEEPDRQITDHNRQTAATEGDAYCSISNGSCVSASVPSHQPPPGPPLQFHIQLQQQEDEAPNSSSTISSPTSGSSPSVSIRVRGYCLSVSVIDTREPYTSSSFCSSHSLLMLSAVLDELEAHHLRLLRSTHCRDGTKLLHYSESKIAEEMGGTPIELKAKLQHLAHKLRSMRNTGNA